MSYPFAQHNLRTCTVSEGTSLPNFKSVYGNIPTGAGSFFGSCLVTRVWISITASTTVSGSGSTWTYNASYPGGDTNSLVGVSITVAGAGGTGNNGTFTVTASTASSITVNNPSGSTATATSTTITLNGNAAMYVMNLTQQTFGISAGNAFFANCSFTADGNYSNAGNKGTFTCVNSGAQGAVLTNATAVNETTSGICNARIDQFVISSVANASGGLTVYTGNFPGGTSSIGQLYGWKDYVFVISGFTNPANNGTFLVVGSSTTTITVVNASGVAESGGTYFARSMSGLSWFLTTAGFTQTTDPGQVTWQDVNFTNQVTGADGTIGANKVRYTLSVTPSGIRVGQVFTVTGTTGGTFDLSGTITAINTGSNFVDVLMGSTPSNTSQSGLTATGQVLGITATPPFIAASPHQFWTMEANVITADLISNWRGVWDPTKTYNWGDMVWHSASDPNVYIVQTKLPSVYIKSATFSSTTITYNTYVSHNFSTNQHVTVTGLTNATFNVTNAVITSASGTTFTVTATPSGNNALANQNGLANIVPTNDAATWGSSGSPQQWILYTYEMWQGNDPAGTYYLRTDYGLVWNGAAGYSFQVGSGASGTGYLTGWKSYREHWSTGGNSPSGAACAPYDSQFWSDGVGGEFCWSLWGGATISSFNSSYSFLNLEWGKTNAGAKNGLWLQYHFLTGPKGSVGTAGRGGAQAWVTQPPVGVPPVQIFINGPIGYPSQVPQNGSNSPGAMALTALASTTHSVATGNGNNTPVYPIFSGMGLTMSNPLVNTATLAGNDTNKYFQILSAVDAYGSTHNYLTNDSNDQLILRIGGNSQRAQLLMRWDT